MAMPNQPSATRLSIFIAYRREDVQFAVDRLDSDLRRAFGRESVFRDTKDIGLELWEGRIDRELDEASVVIVAIGPNWLSAVNDQGERRLWKADDRLRMEIEKALDRGIKVVPLTLEGAQMPVEKDLPPSISSLAKWQSEAIDSQRWDEEVAQLIQKLAPVPDRGDMSEDPTKEEDLPVPLPTVWIAVGVLVIVAMIIWAAVGFS